jgi:Ca-activated chloride channel family protein
VSQALSKLNRAACALLVTCITVPAALAGQGWIDPIRPLPGGRIETLRSAVQVAVSGRVARVTVEEWFRNTGPIMGEGNYLYPLPGEAVFSELSLWQGDRELKGEMMDAMQARSIYETIVRLKRDPALIELAGHGLIRARVFPIAPGETRKITLRYMQVLDRVGDAWRFRYASGRDATPRSFHMEVDSAGRIGDPYSPTHRVVAVRRGDHLEVTLADASWSGDLALLLPLTRGLVGMSLITHRPAGESDGYFMALLAPGQAAEAQSLHRDVVGVLDISGSMSGEKLDQAKAALTQLVGGLRPGDRFRLIAFSTTVRRHSAGWSDATSQNVRDAQDWVRSLTAEGGTNIAGALTEAFAAPPADGALGVVVFLTDGLPTAGETDPERIADAADRARGPFRVFSFGIGYDVNTYLLDRLTERARGVTEYVGPGGNIESAVGSLAAKIASPVLTDLALSGDGAEIYDLQPGSLPDLFAGDEMVVLGRYRSMERGPWGVTVTGRRSGREQRFTTRAPADAPGASDYVAHLWAARKAGALGREIRLHGQTPEIMRALKELALRYGILTEYTAYLVQEPGVVATGPLERAPAPTQQFGAPSVAQARRDAKSANAGIASEAAELDDVTRGRMGTARTQQVGGRVFVWRDSTWTDLRHGDSLPVVTVEAFSDAYFALVQALPELVKPVALEPAVLVAGRRVSIKIGASGKTMWSEGELDALVRDFRS